LVKLYADEAGSDQVRAGVAAAKICATHLIAYAETRAAFARKAQQPSFANRLQTWRKDFKRDWPSFEILGVPLIWCAERAIWPKYTACAVTTVCIWRQRKRFGV
jgi:hypothetical protein